MASEGTSNIGNSSPTVIPRSEHNISRALISPNAVKVLYRLQQAGYQACLVGGGVRDLLLGREPKDFDVATNALPEDVRRLFRNCRLIGRRFRLAHILFGREIVEVATFRAHDVDDSDGEADRHVQDGRIMRDNVYGTIEEDAYRRDFTVNALYYDIEDYSVLDFVDGMADLRAGTLRLIGDPEQRYREDPVRMLRAARFAAKLGFRLHPDTESPLQTLGSLLIDMPPSRLYEECLKMFLGGSALATYELLRHYGLFAQLFPLVDASLSHEEQGFPHILLTRAMENTDARVNADKPVTPAFLFAALLWEPMRERAREIAARDGLEFKDAAYQAADEVVMEQVRRVALPKRFSLPMREIWHMQARLEDTGGRRAARLVGHPRFRAAYDFLLLRGEAGEVPKETCDWWTEFQEMDADARDKQIAAKPPRRRRRRGSGSKPQ